MSPDVRAACVMSGVWSQHPHRRQIGQRDPGEQALWRCVVMDSLRGSVVMDRGSVVLNCAPEKLEQGVQRPDQGRELAELELPGLLLPIGLRLGLGPGLKLELGLGQE